MYIHESYKESVIRAYREPNGYQKRAPYFASCHVDYLTEKAVFISSLMGEVNRQMMRKLKEHLKRNGVETLAYERHGKLRVEKL